MVSERKSNRTDSGWGVTWPSKKEAYCCRFGGVEVQGGAVAYTQITRDEDNTTRMVYKVAEVYCKYATCTWTQFGRGPLGCAILLPLSRQLHSSTCV